MSDTALIKVTVVQRADGGVPVAVTIRRDGDEVNLYDEDRQPVHQPYLTTSSGAILFVGAQIGEEFEAEAEFSWESSDRQTRTLREPLQLAASLEDKEKHEN
jgi:hypothetical protein